MPVSRIICLAALALLMAVCFLSDKIAGRFTHDGDKKQKLSLCVKAGTLFVAVIVFLIVFI